MKVKRLLISMLIGGLIGGVIALLMDSDIVQWVQQLHFTTAKFVWISFIVVMGVVVILTGWLFKVQKDALKIKRQMRENLNYSETDDLDNQANMKFLTSSYLLYTVYLITFLYLLVLVIGNSGDKAVLFGSMPFIFTIVPAIFTGIFTKKFDSKVPKYGEKNYTEKLLAVMDEGERHVTLTAMYKVYHINISMIMLGIVLLAVFSLVTASNQFLGLLIMIILFAYNVFGYLTKVSRFYR